MSVGENESAADVRKFSWLPTMCERMWWPESWVGVWAVNVSYFFAYSLSL